MAKTPDFGLACKITDLTARFCTLLISSAHITWAYGDEQSLLTAKADIDVQETKESSAPSI